MSQLVSIIIPIYNGSSWITKCFENILKQSAVGVLDLEICVCDDHSTDNTLELLYNWKSTFERVNIPFKIYRNEEYQRGVGHSKNSAVHISSGKFLCFQDVDDIMLSDRIIKQYERALQEQPNTIIGCKFVRSPLNSTTRYTNWANGLSQEQLNLQVFTSHGPTVIMPTWFCHRSVFESVGGFVESRQGCPEDLIFFNKHLDSGGKIARVDDVLLVYTFHQNQTTFSINEETIWNIRLERLERVVLNKWPHFTIWNAGKQGRKLYKSLCEENKNKVMVFCDVDLNKIGKKYSHFDNTERSFSREIDIIHFKNAAPPFVICMKIVEFIIIVQLKALFKFIYFQDLTDGVFEENLRALNLKEDDDYVLFS